MKTPGGHEYKVKKRGIPVDLAAALGLVFATVAVIAYWRTKNGRNGSGDGNYISDGTAGEESGVMEPASSDDD